MKSQEAVAETYVDMRNLAADSSESSCCPVSGCQSPLGKVPSQWGEMPFCVTHGIRIHAGTRTFAYYNGPDAAAKHDASMRNILFERDYFKRHILGNAAKAETHRISHETSEDALTWNVFSRLANGGVLPELLASLTGQKITNEPELYLWGLGIRLHLPGAPASFPPLEVARLTFEKGIAKFLTEPDIMLYVPGESLVLIEAKFTSGNTVVTTGKAEDLVGEKPKSRQGILARYSPNALPSAALQPPTAEGPFYSQLYRNLVFAIYMANLLGVRWGLVSLVSEGQFRPRESKVEYQDPTPFIHSLLPEKSRSQFRFYSWENVYRDHVANRPELADLGDYMFNKSANRAKALAL